MKILFLDDNPYRHKTMMRNSIGFRVVGVFSAQEAIKAMEEHDDFDLIMLDHDLDLEKQGLILDNEEDGRFVVRWMIDNNKFKNTCIVVHSLNGPASGIMVDALRAAGYADANALPLAWTMIEKTEDGKILFNTEKKSNDVRDYQ